MSDEPVKPPWVQSLEDSVRCGSTDSAWACLAVRDAKVALADHAALLKIARAAQRVFDEWDSLDGYTSITKLDPTMSALGTSLSSAPALSEETEQ